jgi:hypothetical protein
MNPARPPEGISPGLDPRFGRHPNANNDQLDRLTRAINRVALEPQTSSPRSCRSGSQEGERTKAELAGCVSPADASRCQ